MAYLGSLSSLVYFNRLPVYHNRYEEHRLAQQDKQLRAWCAGKTQPPEEVLTTIENIDPKPEILYDQSNIDGSTGELADVMKGLYDKMDSLKRNPDEFRAWTDEDGHITFYDTLLDLTPDEIRLRVNILQQLGTFKFRSGLNGDTKKQLISEIFAPQEETQELLNQQPSCH